MSEAIHGYGSTFERHDGTDFQNVGEMTALTPPGREKETYDATHFASPDKYREFISGFKDGGEAEITCNFVAGNAGQAGMLDDFEDDDANQYRITLPDGTTMEFDGIVTNVTPEVPLEDKISQSFTIKVTGKPVVTLAS